MAGKFEIKKSSDNQYRFNLKAGNIDHSIDSFNKALYALCQCWIVLASPIRISYRLLTRFKMLSLKNI